MGMSYSAKSAGGDRNGQHTSKLRRAKSGPHESVQYMVGWLGRAGSRLVVDAFTEGSMFASATVEGCAPICSQANAAGR